MPRPHGCSVVVVGASSGIGEATARAYARAGARVVAVSRHAAPHSESGIRHVAADVRVDDECTDAVNRAAALLGGIDIVVIAAGVMIVDEVVRAVADDWREMLEVNLLGAMLCARAASTSLVDAARGSAGCADLVLVGSLSGRVAANGRAGYAASKAGLRAFADVLRLELASDGVRVSLIEPGLTKTNLRARSRPEAIERMESHRAGLRDVEPMSAGEVADCIVWMTARPSGVTVSEMTVIPTLQAAASLS